MSRYQRMPVDTLVIDERYQRPVDEKRVEKIAANFDTRLFGVLEVNQRNGKAAVFDGQHRLAAARLKGLDKVPCMVHTDLGPQDEAVLFVKLQQERKKIHPVEQFKARVFAGDEDADEIEQIVSACGFIVAARSGAHAGRQHAIASIRALERAHRVGNLNETLELLGSLWFGDDKSTEGKLIEGLSMLEEGYGHRLDIEALSRLRAESPVTVLRRVKGRVQSMGGESGQARIAFEEMRKIAGLRGAPRKRAEDAA
jgi:hypothetical protein